MSVVVGLIYGVLLPTLPAVPRPIAWGGLLMPILWTGASYVAMQVVNPALPGRVSWPWFMLSQFVFGITMPAVVLGAKRLPRPLAGVAGGLVGGAAMALPAVLWAAASGRGFWYPVNVLAGMLLPGPGNLEGAELGRFHAEWFLAACAIHAVLSIGFGVLFALVMPRLPPMPGPLSGAAWSCLWYGPGPAMGSWGSSTLCSRTGLTGPGSSSRSSCSAWPPRWWCSVRRWSLSRPPVSARTGWLTSWPAKGEVGRERDSARGDRRLLTLLVVLTGGCDIPGKPREADRPVPADQVKVSTPSTVRTAPAATGPTASSVPRRR